jgi:hypothetical protein
MELTGNVAPNDVANLDLANEVHCPVGASPTTAMLVEHSRQSIALDGDPANDAGAGVGWHIEANQWHLFDNSGVER